MNNKEVKNMSRRELLGLLLEQERELEQLRSELESARAALADRSIEIENTGSLAEAALKLNGVFADAEKAAQQYLDNVRLRSGDDGQIIADAQDRADAVIAEAQSRADAIVAEAEQMRDKTLKEVSMYVKNVSASIREYNKTASAKNQTTEKAEGQNE